jgi:hypothetical protein
MLHNNLKHAHTHKHTYPPMCLFIFLLWMCYCYLYNIRSCFSFLSPRYVFVFSVKRLRSLWLLRAFPFDSEKSIIIFIWRENAVLLSYFNAFIYIFFSPMSSQALFISFISNVNLYEGTKHKQKRLSFPSY